MNSKIPGGMMVIPLTIGAMVNTFFPGFLEIGGFTTALFKDGTGALIGAFLVCMGAGLTFKAAPRALLTGSGITISKFSFAIVLGLSIEKVFGAEGFLGLTGFAAICAVGNTNGGLYAALVGEFGDKKDIGALSVISITDGPFLEMLVLGVVGMALIPLTALAGVVIPIIIGMTLGLSNKQIRDFLVSGGPLLIPFFAFSLGTGIDLADIAESGVAGILLGLITSLIGGFLNIQADRITGGSGIAGAAASSTAGNAVATPAAIALADPSMAAVAAQTTPLIAASVVTTAICTPVLTSYVARKRQ